MKIQTNKNVMKIQTNKIIPFGLLTAVAAYFAAGVAVAQVPVLSTKDKVHSRVGVFLGGSTLTADRGGHTGQAGDRAADFGKGTGPVDVKDASFLNDLSKNDEMSFAFWLKKPQIESGSTFWVNSPSSNNGQRGYQAHLPWGDNTIYFDTAGCCNADQQRISASITTFPDYAAVGDVSWWTNWHYFVFQKKLTTKEIWIDGQLFLTGENNLPLPTDFTELFIGAAAPGVNLISGQVDDFAIFGTALSGTTIAELFTGTLPTALPAANKLAAYWDFNDSPAEGSFVSITPLADAVDAGPNLIQIVHIDGTTPWGLTNISLEVDGATVTPSFVKDGIKATVSYVPSPIFTGQTTHKASFTYPGAGGTPATIQWGFTVGVYTKDVVHSYVGTFGGGSAYTPDAGGHTGRAGDRAADFGNGTGPVHVKDASFLNALSTNDEMSFVFWLKKPGIEAGSTFWANSPSSATDQRGYQAHVPWSDSNIYFDTAGCCDGSTQRIYAHISMFPGYSGDVSWWTNWHYFVFQKKLSTKEIWIDGQLFLAGDSTAPLPTDFTELFIGATAPGVNLISGQVDDFAIFGTALSDTTIGELFTGTLPTALSATNKLAAYWNFDDFPAAGLFVSIVPAPNTTTARPDLIRVIHLDGAIVWDQSKVSLKVDDAPVTSAFVKNLTEATVSYVPSPWFAAGSTHNAALTYPGEGGTQATLAWQFSIGTFPVLSENLQTAPGSGLNPGFRINTYQKGGSIAIVNGWRNMLTMANEALAGYYPDNIADLTAFTHDGFYWEPGVINCSGSGDAGNIRGDVPFPGLPGTDGLTGQNAMEVLTFIEFPAAGFYTMGVNSDDGFRVTLGDSVGPDKAIVHVLKPDSLAGDNVGCQTQNGVDGGGFGGPVPIPPLVARAVNADPILAGDTVNVGEYITLNNAAAIKGNIAIVQRGGGIAFNVKAQNCLNAGAIAVVMANSTGDQPGLFGTSGGGVTTIPLILINQADGDALIAAATTDTNSPVVLRIGDDASLTLGEFNNGRGASDTLFTFKVPVAGVYPFRLVWENGAGTIAAGNALSCEWFMQDQGGVKTLINDPTAPGALKAYRDRVVTTPTLSISLSGSQVVIQFKGILAFATTPGGPYTDLTASWPSVASPYSVPASGGPMFFRAHR